jgi:hypothetical protein
MSWVITPELKNVDGVPVGTPYGGGYVAGYISHTADGNPTHALIVAPRETGATGGLYGGSTLAWKTANTATTNTPTSIFDGVANTTAIVNSTDGIAAHPAANFCVNLNIGGFTDWYLPSNRELDIAYFNLKPTADANINPATNIYAIPRRDTGLTASYPAQTTLELFNTSAQQFTNVLHWSSTQQSQPASAGQGDTVSFATGRINNENKTNLYAVRAFRRIAL